jgi:hypothetical protein
MHFLKLSKTQLSPRAVSTILVVVAGFLVIALSGTVRSCAVDPNVQSPLYQMPAAAFDQTPALSQTDVPAFLKMLKQKQATVSWKPETSCLQVPINNKTLYQLQYRTTYQVVATTDSILLHPIIKQLDGQDISYEVFKNTGDYFLLQPGEWIVCWGGILYLPQLEPSVLN